MEKIVARRYAEALYDFAEEVNTLEKVSDDLASLSHFLSRSVEFATLINTPTIDTTKKIDILRNVFKSKLAPTTFIFLQFCATKNRLNLLRGISDQFENICHERKDTLKARIISTIKLNDAQIKEICNKLKSKFKKDILPVIEQDASLIAGFKIQIGDQMFDNSIQYQLEKFKKNLIHV